MVSSFFVLAADFCCWVWVPPVLVEVVLLVLLDVDWFAPPDYDKELFGTSGILGCTFGSN